MHLKSPWRREPKPRWPRAGGMPPVVALPRGHTARNELKRAMPCSNVNEIIRITLDAEERWVGHRLTKGTCGTDIPCPPALLAALRGRTLHEILALPIAESGMDFLAAKHVGAIRIAVGTYVGQMPCGPGHQCLAARISQEVDATTLEVHLDAGIDEAAIQPCSASPCRDCVLPQD